MLPIHQNKIVVIISHLLYYPAAAMLQGSRVPDLFGYADFHP